MSKISAGVEHHLNKQMNTIYIELHINHNIHEFIIIFLRLQALDTLFPGKLHVAMLNWLVQPHRIGGYIYISFSS